MKKWTILGMAGMLAVLTAGCGATSEQAVSTDTGSSMIAEQTAGTDTAAAATEAATETAQSEAVAEAAAEAAEMNLSKSETLAYEFVKALQSEDYTTAYGMLHLDKTFIDQDTFEWLQPRGSYADIIGTDYEITSVTSPGDSTQNNVTLQVGPVEILVVTYLNDDNEWQVNYYQEDVIITPWCVSVPKGMTFSVNGVAVSEDYMIERTDTRDYYELTVAEKECTIVATSPTYGDFEMTTIPAFDSSADEDYRVIMEITGDERDRILEEVKALCNEILALYESGETESTAYTSYVSDKADTSFVTTLCNSLESGFAGTVENEYSDVMISQMKPTDDSENTPCFVYADDTVAINFMMEKTWYDNVFNDQKATRVYTYFVVEETEEGWKLVNMDGSNNPFVDNNFMTKKW